MRVQHVYIDKIFDHCRGASGVRSRETAFSRYRHASQPLPLREPAAAISDQMKERDESRRSIIIIKMARFSGISSAIRAYCQLGGECFFYSGDLYGRCAALTEAYERDERLMRERERERESARDLSDYLMLTSRQRAFF